jgi:hypothetical protein
LNVAYWTGACAGLTHVRARCNPYQASDSIDVTIRISPFAPFSLAGNATQVFGSVGVGNPPSNGPVYTGGTDGTNIRPVHLALKGAQPGGTPYYVATQRAIDGGRNNRTFYRRPVITTNAEVMASVSQYYSGAAVGATATPAVVPAGKTLRIEQVGISYMGVATAGGAVVTMRVNTSGTAVIGSPQFTEWFVGAPAGAGNTYVEDFTKPDGMEFAAGTGIAFGVQGFSAAMAAAATGYVGLHIVAFEY